ncbi:hypothetical protein [Paracoccus onubensis]|uniref:hypothetical protein n=1 Tax=Paracoccus onubensis TaxID=1675788 RepID=UPI0015FEC1DA|nr:hypothetical protein [Paracoccus onubensis]
MGSRTAVITDGSLNATGRMRLPQLPVPAGNGTLTAYARATSSTAGMYRNGGMQDA